MSELYVGKSYYFDGDRFSSEFLSCISDNLNAVILYMGKVRGYQIVDLADPDEDVLSVIMAHAYDSGNLAVVGDITKMSFYSDEQRDEWLGRNHRDKFWMVPHIGKVDRRLSGLSKSEVKDMILPEIVVDMISSEDSRFKAELGVASHSLKELAIFFHGDLENHPYARKAMDMVGIIDSIINGDVDLSDAYASRHPVLFCGEPEHRSLIRTHLQYLEMQEDYQRDLELHYT